MLMEISVEKSSEVSAFIFGYPHLLRCFQGEKKRVMLSSSEDTITTITTTDYSVVSDSGGGYCSIRDLVTDHDLKRKTSHHFLAF